MYKNLTTDEKINYLGSIIILAQREDYFSEFTELLNHAEKKGIFAKVSVPNMADIAVKNALNDVDSTLNNPIENSSSHTNY